MKRTLKPYNRKSIKTQDISINIQEESDKLFVYIKIKNLEDYDFPKKAHVFLEAYNNLDIDCIDLGNVGSLTQDEIKKPLSSFHIPQRAGIKFRLKVTDQKTWRLLGLAERLKERKYANSLLEFQPDPSISAILKIDFADKDHPILHVNKDIMERIESIKPILAELAFREILQVLLLGENDEDDQDFYESHKWIKFAKKYKPIDTLINMDSDEKLNWISEVIDEFSKKHKIPKTLKKNL